MTAIQTDLFSSFADPTPDEGRQRMDAARAASGPAARRTDPETSRLAAADAQPRAARHRDRALAALRETGEEGLTDFELAARLSLTQTSVGKRRLELQRDGLVEATEMRRPSPSGSMAIVWRAT